MTQALEWFPFLRYCSVIITPSTAELSCFLFLELCVFKKPHRFVLKIPEQAQLVHEVWIEREAGRQHQLQKPALAQSENTLASYPGPAEHNDLSISGAI